MASIKHQFIIDCIIRKMRDMAFEPVSIEGKSTLMSSLKIPPKIIRHRPDIIGVNKNYNICIGEAKTNSDVNSKRTKEQLIDYVQSGCLTIMGCPRSCYSELNNLIKRFLPNQQIISILKIPDELMPNDNEI